MSFANNRCCMRVPRGTYRIMLVCASTALTSNGVYFVVGQDDFAKYFGAVPGTATCKAEMLAPCGPHSPAGGAGNTSVCYVEVDVEYDQVVWFWSFRGTEFIKYVKVGDLPARDLAVSDRER